MATCWAPLKCSRSSPRFQTRWSSAFEARRNPRIARRGKNLRRPTSTRFPNRWCGRHRSSSRAACLLPASRVPPSRSWPILERLGATTTALGASLRRCSQSCSWLHWSRLVSWTWSDSATESTNTTSASAGSHRRWRVVLRTCWILIIDGLRSCASRWLAYRWSGATG